MGYGKIYESTWWGEGINNIIGWGQSYKALVAQFLLNQYSADALFGYSLRKVKDDAEFCVRVRRASDNAEENIGFNADNIIDTDALEAFAEGSQCFVVIWFNQLGGTIHLARTNASQQPQITDASGIVLKDGPNLTPHIYFQLGSTLYVTQTNGVYDDSSGWSNIYDNFYDFSSDFVFYVLVNSKRSGGVGNLVFGTASTNRILLYNYETRFYLDDSAINGTINNDGFNNQWFYEFARSSSNASITRNDTQIASGTATGTFEIATITLSGTQQLEGNVYEMIAYNSTANDRAGIYSNVQEYYNFENYS